MKKIILSGRETFYIEKIIKYTDWIIECLIIDDWCTNLDVIRTMGEGRIKNVMTFSEMLEEVLYDDIDFKTIEDMKYAFSVCDYGSRRIMDDYHYSHYEFLMGIATWDSYFKKHQIDAVIISNHYHAWRCDYILQEMALRYNISCYNIYYANINNIGVYNANQNKLLELNFFQDKSIEEAIDKAAYYTEGPQNLDAYFKTEGLFMKLTYMLGGIVLYKKLSLLKNGKSDISYRQYTYPTFCRDIKNFRRNLKNIKKYYSNPVEGENYVIFFLHLEPEAVIPSFATTIDSQVFLIDFLSKSLPEGWVLYVKEHPDTYKYNKGLFEPVMASINTFVTPFFYEHIANTPNVKLVDYKLKATDLIKKSKAIASIAGTVIMEGIKYKKPIFVFGNERQIYKKCKDVFSPESLSQCRTFMEKIKDGFVPNYDDYEEVARKYLTDRNEKGHTRCIEVIKEDLEK